MFPAQTFTSARQTVRAFHITVKSPLLESALRKLTWSKGLKQTEQWWGNLLVVLVLVLPDV